ncbi:hypothetical protein [Sphingobium sp.]|uniref:hypothetical protein n=1 Tax=Sphingobium sp. TaxID=1912891 RepID=UPI0035C6B22F
MCGANCAIVVNDRYRCTSYFRKGTCTNRWTIRRVDLERRALQDISKRLVSAEAVKTAVAAYIEQINASTREHRA